MRLGVFFLAALWLCSCASDKLAQAPPAGVDFSGHWKLNEADSDDPMRLVQSATGQPGAATQIGQGGRAGRGGGPGGGGLRGAGGLTGPAVPSVGMLGAGLRWPGKLLEIKQVAGVVAFSSDGRNRVCQPESGAQRPQRSASDPEHRPSRYLLPPKCGWLEKTLIVQGGDPDEDRPPFEERYSLSDDKDRLIEVIGFKGGRSGGFTMSRAWDRVTE